jgi:hypothetical protein
MDAMMLVISPQALGFVLSFLAGKLLHAAATSGAVKGAVAKFADDVLLKEQFLKLSEVDVAYWTYWLSTSGYSSQVGDDWHRAKLAGLPC